MTTRRARRTTGVAVLALVVPLGLAGCGGDEPAATTAPHSTASSTEGAVPGYNPCDGVDPKRVSRLLGEAVTEDVGTTEVPRCRLLPAADGGAVLDANYLYFPEGLDAAWEAMGAPDDGAITEPEVPGADATRMVVGVEGDTLSATGFVQDGDLVQVVNGVDPAPHDRRRLLAAVTAVLAQVSAHAGDTSDTGGTGTP